MKKGIAWMLCLILLAGTVLPASAKVSAEQTAKEMEAIAEWEEQYGKSYLWDYRLSAAFAAAHPDFFDDPSMMAVLPDENDPETISAEKAKKLAFRLLPQYNLGITADELFGLECVVSSYRKPEHVGSFFSINGSWNVTFWNTAGESPEMVYSLFLDAVYETPDVLMLGTGVRYECFFEACQDAVRVDPHDESDETGRARLKAREIAAERFDAGYGIDEYYADLIGQFGLFRFWTPEQKHQYCAILEELLYWERQRLNLYYAGESRPAELHGTTILQWGYGSPESAAVPEEDARQMALDFLRSEYGADCTDSQVSVSLYTGHWHNNPFADPYWVFGFYDGDNRLAEVWVNAESGTLPKHRMDDAEEIVREQFSLSLQEGYEIGGKTVTEDMIDDVAVLYLEGENEWYGIVAVGDSYWEFELDADTLEPLDFLKSNG